MQIITIPQGSMIAKRCFSLQHLRIVVDYAAAMQRAIEEYDTVVLVARRALCLYRALTLCGMINPAHPERVISSRALRMPDSELVGPRIAVFDDAALSGLSLTRALDDVRRIAGEGALVDTFVAVRCTRVLASALPARESQSNGESMQRALVANLEASQTFAMLEARDALNFCRSVIEFTQATGAGSNVDNPLFYARMSPAEVDSIVQRVVNVGFSLVNVSRPIHVASGISSFTVTFDSADIIGQLDAMAPSLGMREGCGWTGVIDPSESLFKVRIQIDRRTSTLTVIPFVLVGKVDADALHKAYVEVSGDGLLHDVLREDDETGARGAGNELSLVSYALSYWLGRAFMARVSLDSLEYDRELERMVFGKVRLGARWETDTDGVSLTSLDGSPLTPVRLDECVAKAKAYSQLCCDGVSDGMQAEGTITLGGLKVTIQPVNN